MNKTVKSKKKTWIIIGIIIVFSSIIGYFSFHETIKYEVKETFVQNKVNKKIPYTKYISINVKEVVAKKSFLLSKLVKDINIDLKIDVDKVKVEFEKDSLNIMTHLNITYKEDIYPLDIISKGNIVYDKSGAFFYKIVSTNSDEAIEKFYPLVKERLIVDLKEKVQKLSDNGITVKGIKIDVDAVKNKLSGFLKKYTKDNNDILDKSNDELIDKLEQKIDNKKLIFHIEEAVTNSITNFMKKTPVYTLNDDKNGEYMAKLFLDRIEFKKDVMIIHMSLHNITTSILAFLLAIFLSLGLLFGLSRSDGSSLALGVGAGMLFS